MTQNYEPDGQDQYDDEYDNEEDFIIDPYPVVSLELPPPHMDALKKMLSRIVPEDEFEAEIRDTLLNYQVDVELEEIRQLAEFRSVLAQYADTSSESEA